MATDPEYLSLAPLRDMVGLDIEELQFDYDDYDSHHEGYLNKPYEKDARDYAARRMKEYYLPALGIEEAS